MTTNKKPLLANKSVAEKMTEIDQEEAIQGEMIPSHVDTSPLEMQQVMKKYRLQKATRGIRVDLEEDLHSELKILCIRLGKTQEEFLRDLISGAVKKEIKKFEK